MLQSCSNQTQGRGYPFIDFDLESVLQSQYLLWGKITDTQPAMEGSCPPCCCAPAGRSCILLQSCVNPITPILVLLYDYMFLILLIWKIALENHQMHWTLLKFHSNEHKMILMWSKRLHYCTFPSYTSLHFGCKSHCWAFSFPPWKNGLIQSCVMFRVFVSLS